jgi:hypothetical protein
MAKRVSTGLLEDVQVPLAHRVFLDPRERLVLRVFLDLLVHLVQQGLLVRLDLPDLPDLLDPLDLSV